MATALRKRHNSNAFLSAAVLVLSIFRVLNSLPLCHFLNRQAAIHVRCPLMRKVIAQLRYKKNETEEFIV